MKILKGYVENRTREVALAAMLGALALVARKITIPIAPFGGIECSIIFWATIVLVLSYPYVWWVAAIIGLTSGFGILTVPGTLIGQTVFYFLVKFAGIKRGKYLSFFGTTFTVIFSCPILAYIGVWPPGVFMPAVIKSFVQGLIAIIMVPPFLRLLEKLNFVDFGGKL